MAVFLNLFLHCHSGNRAFCSSQNAILSGIPFGFLATQETNGISNKIAFLQGRTKKRFFRNDGRRKVRENDLRSPSLLPHGRAALDSSFRRNDEGGRA